MIDVNIILNLIPRRITILIYEFKRNGLCVQM